MQFETNLQRTLRVKIDAITRHEGFLFRWKRGGDKASANGMVRFDERVLWVDFYLGPEILSHELAHLTQAARRRGRTVCDIRQDPVLAAEHSRLTQNWVHRLRHYGVHRLWRAAQDEVVEGEERRERFTAAQRQLNEAIAAAIA